MILKSPPNILDATRDHAICHTYVICFQKQFQVLKNSLISCHPSQKYQRKKRKEIHIPSF